MSLSTYIKRYRQLYTVKQYLINQEQFNVSEKNTNVHENSNLREYFVLANMVLYKMFVFADKYVILATSNFTPTQA